MSDKHWDLPSTSTSGLVSMRRDAQDPEVMSWPRIIRIFNNTDPEVGMAVLEDNYNLLLEKVKKMKTQYKQLKDKCASVEKEKNNLQSELKKSRMAVKPREKIVIESTSSDSSSEDTEEEAEQAKQEPKKEKPKNGGMNVSRSRKRRTQFAVEYMDPKSRKTVRVVSNMAEEEQINSPSGIRENMMPNARMVMQALQYVSAQRTMAPRNNNNSEDSD